MRPKGRLSVIGRWAAVGKAKPCLPVLALNKDLFQGLEVGISSCSASGSEKSPVSGSTGTKEASGGADSAPN